ncbi:hypothetical protein [Shewanella benthica]|uniref:Putative lipoprotein n=1 Tax=Shewanella benthica KT99 TaxID=314608 RepID=A9D228_9GAMM|nr:hypothetical protein [Shewanella benthica]EDQ01752.1 putative lipoprotein [Shewanella benthica KT99]
MNKVLLASLLVTSLVTVVACDSDASSTKSVPETTGAGTDTTGTGSKLSAATLALDITGVPDSLSATYSSVLKFNRYTQVQAPNGKSIHLIAQDKLSDNQIVRARSILTHYLDSLS